MNHQREHLSLQAASGPFGRNDARAVEAVSREPSGPEIGRRGISAGIRSGPRWPVVVADLLVCGWRTGDQESPLPLPFGLVSA